MAGATHSAHLRAVSGAVEAARAEADRSQLAGELLVLVSLGDPATPYVVHRDDTVELKTYADDVPGVSELRTTLARTAVASIVAERATWRGRHGAAWDALRGE